MSWPRFRVARPGPMCRRVLRFDELEPRDVPAIVATFTPGNSTLTVLGDGLNNTITVSRDAAGQILVNDGAVAVQGGTPTVVNVLLIEVRGQGGNDTISLNQANGLLPAIRFFGGAGNDTLLGGDGNDSLFGGDGNDFIDGNRGSDVAQMGAGNDVFQWDPGDGSDVVEGQAGLDTLLFNGANIAEKIEVSANGSRVRFTRDVANIVMDLDGVEAITFNALGGADTITVNALSGTDVTRINLHLAPFGSTGDGAADHVIVNGSNANNVIRIVGTGGGYTVQGLHTVVAVDGSEGALDQLNINALGGNDTVNAGSLAAGVVGLAIDGGTGNDSLFGSAGADLLIGNDGNDLVDGDRGDDTALMGAGDDRFVWNPGDGNDIVEGQDGTDTLAFNGANINEQIDISANGSRVRFTRDVANIVMDLNGVETINFTAKGGADTVTVDDLTGTDATAVNVNLGAGGLGDTAADSVVVNGTAANDNVAITGAPGAGVSVAGLVARVKITNADPVRDQLIVNVQAGDDDADASGLAAGVIHLTLNGGAGTDSLIGSRGGDVITGGPGDDLALMGAGNDTFVWNPGDGNDTVEGQSGSDTLAFNGANINEKIDISANGRRVRFTRDVASIFMDLNGVEAINFAARGGADAITVHDLSGTSVTSIGLDLAGVPGTGTGDGAADAVVVEGTSRNDAIRVAGGPGGVNVSGLAARVRITASEAANDALTINSLAGNDTVNAALLADGAIQLTEDGGDGNDTLVGSAGADVLIGEAGDDRLVGGPGVDVLNAAPGNDVVIQ